MKRITYKTAGVDVDKANRLVGDYRKFAASTKTKGVLGNVGGFGALFRPELKRYKDPILVSSTDGVGTKLKIAFLAGKHDTVGIDLVAMSANDILCSGAEGLFFLDYIATGRIEPKVLKDVVKGISVGCRQAGFALVGGETAEMPGMYTAGEYDLAGFGVGIVERSEIIDGTSIRAGDAVLGLESSGLHSNGYSLVRKIFSQKDLKRHSSSLLQPTRLYAKHVLKLKKRVKIKGIANVTGGAFYDKVSRIIPSGLAIEIDKSAWKPHRIFSIIQENGQVEDRDMYHTFNMGIGLVLVISRKDVDRAQRQLKKSGLRSYIIGRVLKGRREVTVI